MPKWEYLKRSLTNDLTEIELNVLGELGWQLVSVLSTPARITYIFMRPLDPYSEKSENNLKSFHKFEG